MYRLVCLFSSDDRTSYGRQGAANPRNVVVGRVSFFLVKKDDSYYRGEVPLLEDHAYRWVLLFDL